MERWCVWSASTLQLAVPLILLLWMFVVWMFLHDIGHVCVVRDRHISVFSNRQLLRCNDMISAEYWSNTRS